MSDLSTTPNTQPEENINDDFVIEQTYTPGSIVDINITDELKRDYLDYAMSVIVARALPDVRDGLKPSQRRLLVAMKDLQLWPDKAYSKSAKIVGETLGKYHPHGDQATYTTLVHMAQDFSYRYPLVDGQGNFGSIDGDPPAQMRYTEAKMAKIATELLRGLDKNLVTFTPNYDGTKLEPTVLPAHIPNLFANGAEGIAVGMATKIPPHNLGELIDALVAIIDAGNRWQGIALYNILRKIKEKIDKRPYLYEPHPQSYYTNYFLPHDDQKAEKIKVLEKIIRTNIVDPKEIKEVFTQKEAQLLLEALVGTYVESEEKITLQDVSLYPKIETDLTVKELIKYVKGPDFPTYGIIYNQKDILNLYETGKGKILVRGVVKVEELKRGKKAIVITEIPYQVNKAVLVQSIAKLVQNKKVKGISDIRDESNKEGIRVVIELKSSANPQIIINKLYKYTPLQINYHANMIALVDKQPITLNLKRYLELYLQFRTTLEIRKLEYELAESKYRGHIVEGLLKAIDIIDEIIATIKASKTQEEAKINLIDKFGFTEIQAQAILDMPLKRLAALERQKLEEEYSQLKATIEHHEKHLSDVNLILQLVKEDLLKIKEKYADSRRTKIVAGKPDEPTEDELIQEETALIILTAKGYIKRTPYDAYRIQRRGGVGSKSTKLTNGDFVKQVVVASTRDYLLVFAQDGKVYKLRVYDIPEQTRQSKGIHIANLVAVPSDVSISKIIPITKREQTDGWYLTFLTKHGLVKKTSLSEYTNIHRGGIKAIILRGNDQLVDVILSQDGQDVLIATSLGQGIRFNTKEIRPLSRSSQGVKGIVLRENDHAISLESIRSDDQVLVTVTENGYIKTTKVSDIKRQKRAGKGIRIHKIDAKRGKLVDAKIIDPYTPDEAPEVIVTTFSGNLIKTTLASVPIQKRTASGVKIIKTSDSDKVVGMEI